MAKWSGKVFFPTSSQASRSMAYGRFPTLPFEVWKPRPEQQQIPTGKVRADGILIMLEYGLSIMSDIRLRSFAAILQDELDRNEQRWIPLNVQHVQRGADLIKEEQDRRQALLNRSECLENWFIPRKPGVVWTQREADSLRNGWEVLLTEESSI